MCFGFCDDGAAAQHLNVAADFGADLVNMFGLVARYYISTKIILVSRETGAFCETEFTRHKGILRRMLVLRNLLYPILNNGFLLPSSLIL